MCQTCHGEGGLTIQQTWGIEFAPCPDSHCDFDKEAAWEETQAKLNRLKEEMNLNATA